MTKNKQFQADTSNNPTLLRQLGWDSHFDLQVAAANATHTHIARVISVQRGLFLVADGQNEWLCSPAGKLLHSQTGDYPVTGDWVFVDDSVVSAVIPRKNILSRGESGARGSRTGATTREQAIAANLDAVFIVCGLDRDFNIRRIERYLALIYNCGLPPVVVLTKADLHDNPDSFRMEVEDIAFGVPVVLTSMLDDRGRSELASHLGVGRTIAMVGSSGAGKSTLANMLYGDDIQSTGAISSYDGKGRHTTTARELIRMPQGGMLMDNPGIREIAFHEDGHGVESAFAEIQELAESCRFADCSHQNEPGCAVLRAVEDGELLPDRLESYHKMKREMQYLLERRTKSADRIEKERWQEVALLVKQIKQRPKYK
ncbi:MAG: ribosome small subunit-dependent GTPase A [Proteobacteria bacterium]|nr:ribosome small subunit-dependent GTPase A [Pseudomonadota bacterium]